MFRPRLLPSLARRPQPAASKRVTRRACSHTRLPRSSFRRARSAVYSLQGHWPEEHLFSLKQALALIDAYAEQIKGCDAELRT